MSAVNDTTIFRKSAGLRIWYWFLLIQAIVTYLIAASDIGREPVVYSKQIVPYVLAGHLLLAVFSSCCSVEFRAWAEDTKHHISVRKSYCWWSRPVYHWRLAHVIASHTGTDSMATDFPSVEVWLKPADGAKVRLNGMWDWLVFGMRNIDVQQLRSDLKRIESEG